MPDGSIHSSLLVRLAVHGSTMSTTPYDLDAHVNDAIANEKHNQQDQQHSTRLTTAHFSAAVLDEEDENGRTEKCSSQTDDCTATTHKNHKERRRDARERTRGTHNTKSQVASSTHLRRWIASVTGTTGSRNDSRISFICSRRCERCPNTSRADDSSPSDDLAIVAYPHSNLHAL